MSGTKMSFIGGVTATCIVIAGVIGFSDYTFIAKSSIISQKDLDENYLPKIQLEKVYVLRSEVNSKFTPNSTVKDKYYEKSIVEDKYINRDVFDKLKYDYDEAIDKINGIPTPFVSLQPSLTITKTWKDEKLGVVIKRGSFSWSERAGNNVDFTIKLPNTEADKITFKDSNYKSFIQKFNVHNRTFEIKLIDIHNRIFQIREVLKQT